MAFVETLFFADVPNWAGVLGCDVEVLGLVKEGSEVWHEWLSRA